MSYNDFPLEQLVAADFIRDPSEEEENWEEELAEREQEDYFFCVPLHSLQGPGVF